MGPLASDRTGQPAPGRELRLRVFSAALLAPLALAAELAGGLVFTALVTVVAVVALWEWTAITVAATPLWLRYAVAALLAAGLLLLGLGATRPGAALVAFPALASAPAMLVSRRALWIGLGVAYVGAPCAALVILRDAQPFGWAAVLTIFGVVWATDTSAYFGGRALGGPKLWARVSPKKTWSGALTGLAGAMLAGALIAPLTDAGSVKAGVLIAIPLSVASQAGDLLESALKRRFGVKDSGRIIPGHGGVLDRMDGVFGAAVVAWLIAAAGLGGALLALPGGAPALQGGAS